MLSKRIFKSFVVCILFFSGCSESLNKSAQGGLAGAAIGSGTGAIIGSQSGHAGAGIAIGAGLGALGGALIGNSLDQIDADNAQRDAQIAKNQAQIEENARLIDELKKRGADVRSSNRGVVINLPDILFEFDRAELTQEAKRTVAEISDVIKNVQRRNIAVEGHTDSIGAVKYNKDLSLRRAQSVATELRSHNVSSSRMNVKGFGEGAPIATNNTEVGRARNRRVEIIVEN